MGLLILSRVEKIVHGVEIYPISNKKKKQLPGIEVSKEGHADSLGYKRAHYS